MKPATHAVISLGVSALLLTWTKSWAATLACFLSGIFIDIDHHLDYCLVRGKFPFFYRELQDYCLTARNGKLYLIFHSYELLLIFWIILTHYRLDGIWIGIAIGMSVHLFCDQWSNPLKPLAYFITYRIKHGFEAKRLLVEGYLENIR